MDINIIKRVPTWITDGSKCTFYFQVDKKPALHKIPMIYLKNVPKGKYYFFNDNRKKSYYEELIMNDEKLKEDFLKEIEKWRLGGSYRRAHPISLDRLGELKKERDIVAKRKLELDREIEAEMERSIESKVIEYKSDIDYKSLKEFVDKINKVISESGFSIRSLSCYDFGNTYVYDTKKEKYIAKCDIYDDMIETKELCLSDVRRFL